MSAERFLNLVERRGLVDEATLGQLRSKVAAAGRPVTASKVAQVLVDRGRLTKYQATQLLNEMSDSDTDPADSSSLLISDAGAPEHELPKLEELPGESHGLTVLEPVEVELPAEPVAEPARDIPVPKVVSRERNQMPPAPERAELGDPVDVLVPDEVAEGFPEAPQRRRSLMRALTNLLGRRKVRRGQSWDSLLMVLGGGALLLLILVGALLYLVLAVGSGDELFAQAEQDYQSQLYRNAIERYEKLVRKYPKHAKASLARVRQGTSRIRMDVEKQNWTRAIDTIERQLGRIENESAFAEARPELSAILTDVYGGLVQQADESDDFEQKQSLLAETARVQTLIDNATYLPTSQRKSVQTRIEMVEDDVRKIERDISRHHALQKAVVEIGKAVGEQSSTEAYEIRDKLLSAFPGLQRNAQLLQTLRTIPQAEKGGISLVSQGPGPQVDDRPQSASPLVLARRVVGQVSSDEGMVFPLIRGAVYGVAAQDGALRWRRWVGFGTLIQPIPLNDPADPGVLVWDGHHRELSRLSAATGVLQWRVTMEAEIAAPAICEDTVLVPLESGRLLQLGLAEGRTRRAVKFPQGLMTTPTVDLRRGVIYLPAQHSSLYVLDAESLECLEVAYVGHADGMIAVPPVVAGDHLFIVENSGEDYCHLHTFVRDASGLQLEMVGEPVRLNGQVFDAPRTFGRYALLATDTGSVYSFEADIGNTDEPVRLYTRVRASGASNHRHYARLVNQRIIVAGAGVSEFELQAARGEIVRKWAYGVDTVHLMPPDVRRDCLVVVQGQSDSLGARVEALRLPGRGANRPELLWKLDVGAPPAVPPFIDRQGKRINVISSGGAVWSVSRDDIQVGIVDRPAGAKLEIAALDHAAELSDGRIVLTDDRGSRTYWIYNPNARPPRLDQHMLQLTHASLTCSPVSDGQRIIVCTRDGPVFVVDPDTGRPTTLPFQPAMAPGMSVEWNPPLLLDKGHKLLSTREGLLYLIREEPQTQPHLFQVRSGDLKINIRPRLAALGGDIFAVQRKQSTDLLVRINNADLRIEQGWPLESTVEWGPELIDDKIALTTSDQKLWVFSGKSAWSVDLPFGPLAGRPLIQRGRWLFSSAGGRLFAVDPESGRIDQSVSFDLGEPLALGPLEFGDRLLLSGRDGTIYFATVE